MLTGKKTYIVAGFLGVLAVLRGLGVLDEATYQSLLAVLTGTGLATTVAAVHRVESKQ